MTIRKSNPVISSAVLAGDFIRIIEPYGAAPALGGPRLSPIAKGAFGRVVALPDGLPALEMHQLMPDAFLPLRHIRLTEQTLVERITFDNEGEVAVIGLDYLRNMSDLMRNLLGSGAGAMFGVGGSQEEVRAVVAAQFKPAAEKIAAALAQSGLSVVERIERQTVISRRVYLTANPESMREGVIPADAVAYEITPERESSSNVEVHSAEHISELLATPGVRNVNAGHTPAAATSREYDNLPPFLRGLIGAPAVDTDGSTLTPGDLGMGEGNDGLIGGEEDDFRPGQ